MLEVTVNRWSCSRGSSGNKDYRIFEAMTQKNTAVHARSSGSKNYRMRMAMRKDSRSREVLVVVETTVYWRRCAHCRT